MKFCSFKSLEVFLRRNYVARVEDKRDEIEDEPLAEADGLDCDVPADECEFGSGDREGKAMDSDVSFREEIFESFQPVTVVLVESSVDGMPVPVDSHDLAVAHPFTRETMVCVEDDTAFIEIFDEEAPSHGWEGLTGSRFKAIACDGGSVVASILNRYNQANGAERERRVYEPERVERLFGVYVVREDDGYVAVRMRRERCQFFLRQVMANDDVPNPKEPGHLIRFSNCTARRSVGGAFMTLRDEAMYACDYRSPVDPATAEKYMDSFDRMRLNGKRHLELVKPFRLG